MKRASLALFLACLPATAEPSDCRPHPVHHRAAVKEVVKVKDVEAIVIKEIFLATIQVAIPQYSLGAPPPVGYSPPAYGAGYVTPPVAAPPVAGAAGYAHAPAAPGGQDELTRLRAHPPSSE